MQQPAYILHIYANLLGGYITARAVFSPPLHYTSVNSVSHINCVLIIHLLTSLQEDPVFRLSVYISPNLDAVVQKRHYKPLLTYLLTYSMVQSPS